MLTAFSWVISVGLLLLAVIVFAALFAEDRRSGRD